jgi:hypothetical protein
VRGPILEIYLWPPGSALYSTTAGRHNLNSCTNLSNMVTPPPQKYLFLVHDSRGTLGPLISTSNPTRMCTIKEPSRLSNTLGNRGGHQAQADRHAAATAPCFSAIHAHHHVHHVHSRAPGCRHRPNQGLHDQPAHHAASLAPLGPCAWPPRACGSASSTCPGGEGCPPGRCPSRPRPGPHCL